MDAAPKHLMWLLRRAEEARGNDPAQGLALAREASETASHQADSVAYAQARLIEGRCLAHMAQFQEALVVLGEALRIAKQENQHQTQIMAQAVMGGIHGHLGQAHSAQVLLEDALHHAQQHVIAVGTEMVRINLASLHQQRNELDAALAHLHHAIEICRSLRLKHSEAYALGNTAQVYWKKAEQSTSQTHHDFLEKTLENAHACLGCAKDTQDKRVEALARNILAQVFMRRAQTELAAEQIARQLEIGKTLGNISIIGGAWVQRAGLLLLQNNPQEALQACTHSLGLLRGVPSVDGLREAYQCLISIHHALGQPELAQAAHEALRRLGE